MLYRFKGIGQFKTYDRKALFEFLKLNTTTSGKLTTPFEIIRAGMLNKGEPSTEDCFPWVFSTFDNDRFDECVDPAGWDLTAYLNNPVILWAHCHNIPAIGVTLEMKCEGNLSGRICFNAKEYDEFGWGIGERVKNGVIRAGSVGFLVKEVECTDHKKNPEEECELIIRKQELLEFSICNVPANPFALRMDSIGNKGIGGPTTYSSKDGRNGFWPFLENRVNGGRYG